MNKNEIIIAASNYLENSEENYISKHIALSEDVVGIRIFDEPVFAFGDVNDVYFEKMKDPSVIGEHFLLPKQWLPEAKTVISYFLPFSEEIKKSNRQDMIWPSKGWLHARIEGQALNENMCRHLKDMMQTSGYKSIIPALDIRYFSKFKCTFPEPSFTSNWSERHVAYICGLGTFGLSKGLITKKGVAGRFGSIITELLLPPDKREYEGIYEYCSMCGKCIVNCPANAISIDSGKNHCLCSDFLDVTVEKCKPRFGCGKCQVDVPCESQIPCVQKKLSSFRSG